MLYKRFIILLNESRLHKVPPASEVWIVCVKSTFGFNDDHLMDLTILALDNKEIRRIKTDTLPMSADLLKTADTEFSQIAVAVVVNLQTEFFDLGKCQDLIQKSPFKRTVRFVWQIMEGSVLVRMR